MSTADFWNERHRSNRIEELSWFQRSATTSLELIDEAGCTPADGVIDVGGGASPLVDGLIERGFMDLAVLDVSAEALGVARRRVGAAPVSWICADVTSWVPDRSWRLWHDRAVFHFMSGTNRDRYLDAMAAGLDVGGAAVVGVFAPDGPERCSGLSVERYGPEQLVEVIDERVPVELVASRREMHPTPAAVVQPFTWVACRRVA